MSSTTDSSWTPPGGDSHTSTSSSGPTPTPTSTVAAAIVETVKTFISTAVEAATTTAATTTTTATTASTSFTPTTESTTTTGDSSSSSSAPFSSTTKHAASGMMNVADMSSSLQHFGIVDYLVFVLMLVVCAVIGFYFGFIEKKQKKRSPDERRGSEALDYLVGGRKMKVFPVSLSLVASFVSGISLLGTSTEIYVYGTQYAFVLITLAISGVISWYVFLPVFCNLQLTSTYEYFEMRFDKVIRLFGSVLFTFGTIVWLPIVIYVPALAFNQVTGVNIHIVTPIVCIVCIFYTCVGGLKAVVWTDVIQTFVMLGAIATVIIKGTADVGGLAVVWQRNLDSGRIEAPTLTWDPTERLSVLSVFVGATIYYTQTNICNQVIVQRYLSLPGLKQVKSALIWFHVGVIGLLAACYYNGMLIFATYHDCDPLSTKLAKAKDQLVPLLVMDVLGVYPGMAGIFVSGVFSAALSSLSTGLNSLSAVFLEDYIKPNRKTPLTEYQTAIVMRLTVVVVGIISVLLVFVVERMGTVLQLSMTLQSITSGPLLGIFLMGLVMPWINGKSALTGCITAVSIMAWICIKGQLAVASGELRFAEKPVTTEGCKYNFEAFTSPANSSSIISKSTDSFIQNIYHMSFLYYVGLGAVISITFAWLASLKFGRNDPSEMDLKLFSPFMHKFIRPKDYASVQQDEQTVIMDLDEKDSCKT